MGVEFCSLVEATIPYLAGGTHTDEFSQEGPLFTGYARVRPWKSTPNSVLPSFVQRLAVVWRWGVQRYYVIKLGT